MAANPKVTQQDKYWDNIVDSIFRYFYLVNLDGSSGLKSPKASLRVRRRMKLLPGPPLLWKGEDGLTAQTHQLTPSGFV